jgi:C-methyltransferase C-terminal domain/Putative zinc binding domain/Methyltransferase domain
VPAAELTARGTSVCRGCEASPLVSVLDLGEQPVSNRLITDPKGDDPAFPLHLRVCPSCGLGQIGEYLLPDQIFDDEYPYLSSMSTTWLAHAEDFAARVTAELELDRDSLVVEAASNDGYLLARFAARGIRVLGVEPSGNVADVAIANGVPTRKEFFGVESARRIVAEHGHPRVVVANNVLAHVPDIADFAGGFAALCDERTVISVENPSFAIQLDQNQFDTIYHEHFSYLTAHAVRIFARRAGLDLWRVERVATHGGSNRYWLALHGARQIESSVEDVIAEELSTGLLEPATWESFAAKSRSAIDGLRSWLDERAAGGRVVVGYGAAAKGNTFLNAVGASAGGLRWVVDASPEKQGKFLPGSHVPVVAPDAFAGESPDDVLILPWNLKAEISALVKERSPGSQSWVAIPAMHRVGT